MAEHQNQPRSRGRTILIMLLIAVIAVCGFLAFRELYGKWTDQQDLEDLSDLVTNPDGTDAGRDLAPLFAQNSDCIGWISIAGTVLDYPVVHTPDEPQKYLHLNFEGEESYAGIPFLDARNQLDDDNLIIYGHNMKNGTMFTPICEYLDPAFREEHPLVEIQTAEGTRFYTVFAIASLKDTDEWYSFLNAISYPAFNEAIARIRSKSHYDMGIIPAFGQQIITLSTCYGEDTDRLVLLAVDLNEP